MDDRRTCPLQVSTSPSSPSQVGCYQLQELLGTGSYAVVHRAHNHESETNGFPAEVAVKIIDVSKVGQHEALPTIDEEVASAMEATMQAQARNGHELERRLPTRVATRSAKMTIQSNIDTQTMTRTSRQWDPESSRR